MAQVTLCQMIFTFSVHPTFYTFISNYNLNFFLHLKRQFWSSILLIAKSLEFEQGYYGAIKCICQYLGEGGMAYNGAIKCICQYLGEGGMHGL